MISKKWDKRFLNLASLVSQWSKDPNTKVGAVIANKDKNVISLGYNGFHAHTLNDDSLYETITREEKRQLTIHAEVNAIVNAAKNGSCVKGSFMYVTLPPCHRCAIFIIQSGVSGVVYPSLSQIDEDFKLRYEQSLGLSKKLFNEANIMVEQVDT